MNRQTVKRLMTKGIVTYVAVFALVLMVAMPAMALIAARNSVNRRSIIDGEVTYKDIGKGQVRTSELGPKAVRYGKIADDAVRRNHIKNGAVTAAKINRTGLNADMLDGSHASAFAGASHNHDTTYVNDNAGEVDNADIAAGAIADSKISYSTKIKVLHIAGAEFRPETSEDKFEINQSGSLNATGTGSVFFYAPIHLPNGAEFTQIVISAWDNNANDINVSLRWRYISGGTYAEIAQVSSHGSEALWRHFSTPTINPSYKIIDNGGRSYFIRVGLSGDAGANHQLGTVQIEYTIAEP